MNGLLACGAYIPHHRLRLTQIGSVHGAAQADGTRPVASYDEDPRR